MHVLQLTDLNHGLFRQKGQISKKNPAALISNDFGVVVMKHEQDVEFYAKIKVPSTHFEFCNVAMLHLHSFFLFCILSDAAWHCHTLLQRSMHTALMYVPSDNFLDNKLLCLLVLTHHVICHEKLLLIISCIAQCHIALVQAATLELDCTFKS